MTPQLRFLQFTDEWQIKKLDDLARKIGDRNSSSSADIVLTNSAIRGVIPQTDFFDKEIAVQGNLANYYKIEKDDFVYNPRISVSAPVGPFKRNHFGCGVMSPLYSIYRFNESEVLDYFEQYLDTKYWHKYMKDVANYGARSDRMAIASNDLLGLPFPYPSKPEQEKIATFLTLVDDRIAKHERKIELLEKYKKGVMQKIFTQQIRFKDESGNPYPDWEERRLGKIGDFYRGLSYDKSNVKNSGNLVLRSSNIKDDKLDYSNDLQFVNKSVQPNIVLQRNDIAVCMANGSRNLVGKSAIYDGGYDGTITVGAFCSIYRTKNSLGKFLFQTRNYRKYLDMLLAGTNINNLKSSDLADLSFYLPVDSGEQEKIATFLTALDDKIKAEQTRLTAAKQWKKGLLQRMFV